jgi:tetratricopeptide (TPR) repeat protein
VTGYRAALPDHAGPAENHNSRSADAQAAGLPEVLGSDAERLIGASVYREPADRDPLLFPVGPDLAAAWAPGRPSPEPPDQEPADLDRMIAECQSASLHDLIEARHHLLEAGETAQAWRLTEMACCQLHARGDFGQEATLISDTLVRLPEHSTERAGWIFELGRIAQVRTDYAVAEGCFKQALDIFAEAGDRAGVSRCHYSLGVLAQARGDYAEAELCYRQSADAASNPAAPVAQPTPAMQPAPATQPTPPTRPTPATRPTPPPTRPTPPTGPTAAMQTASPAGGAATPVAQAAIPDPLPYAARGRSAAWRRLTSRAAQGRPTEHTHPTGHAAQWRGPGLVGLALGLLALSVTEITTTLTSAVVASPAPPPGAASGPSAIAGQEAAAWVAGQVTHSAVVSCDPAMCSELETRGVPAGDLLMLGPGSPRADGPLGSDVVVATRAVRSEFGSRLADAYAPVVLAAFGSGGARVEIRAVAPGGAAAYRDALAGDLAARRQAGGQLLRNPDISASAAARGPLSDGSVDSRLLVTLAALAGLRLTHQLRIISFGKPDPGASAGVPLRSAEIEGPASQALLAFLRAQRAPYLAAVIRAIRLPGGQTAVRVGFASPSPLGLLATASPTAQAAPPA